MSDTPVLSPHHAAATDWKSILRKTKLPQYDECTVGKREVISMNSEQLWAPWRLPYITGPKESRPAGCFLCRYHGQPELDAENYVVARRKRSLVVLNRFPYNNGHLLVAPHEHKASLAELDDEELLCCAQAMQHMTVLLSRVLSAEGYNVGLNLGQVAGAGLPGHLHWHIVPRWTGDANFMPVVAGVHVIPQSLAALFALLKKTLAVEDGGGNSAAAGMPAQT